MPLTHNQIQCSISTKKNRSWIELCNGNVDKIDRNQFNAPKVRQSGEFGMKQNKNKNTLTHSCIRLVGYCTQQLMMNEWMTHRCVCVWMNTIRYTYLSRNVCECASVMMVVLIVVRMSFTRNPHIPQIIARYDVCDRTREMLLRWYQMMDEYLCVFTSLFAVFSSFDSNCTWPW